MTLKETGRYLEILETIPSSLDTNELMNYIELKEINTAYWKTLKEFTKLTDEKISSLFNINVKTYRNQKRGKPKKLSENSQEQIVALLTLFKHGKVVFGSINEFIDWLTHENFFFDGNSPDKDLKTISGMKFIDDRLTGMEFGDNV